MLAVAVAVTAINVPTSKVKADSIQVNPDSVNAEYTYQSGDAWTLIPQTIPTKVFDESLNGGISVGYHLSPNTDEVFVVSTKDVRYNNLVVSGRYNGSNFTITGIATNGYSKDAVLYIPDEIKLAYAFYVPVTDDTKVEEGIYAKDTGLKYYTDVEDDPTKLVENSVNISVKGRVAGECNTKTARMRVSQIESIRTSDSTASEFSAISIPQLNASDAFGDKAFADNQSIKEVDMSRFKGVTLTGSGVFYNCQNLKTVVLNEEMSQLPESTFEKCFKLENIKISQITDIGSKCFSECHALSAPNISGKLKTLTKQCFSGTDISEINLLNTNITSIGNNAFTNNANIRRAFLSKTITDISSSSFPFNTMDYIYLDGTEDQLPSFAAKDSYEYKNKFVCNDTEGPVLLTAEADTLGGTFPNNSITKASVIYIYDAVDVDTDSIKVYNATTNEDVTSKMKVVVDKKSVNKIGHKTIGAHFDVNDLGVYKVVSSDVLGNESTRYIYFQTNIGDTEAPKIKVNNLEVKNGETKKTMTENATIEVSDDVGVDEFTINGSEIKGANSYAVSKGEYNVIVKDKAGNTTSCKVIIAGVDKEAPVISGVENGGAYNHAVTITVTDDSKFTITGSATKTGDYDEAKGTIKISKTGDYELTATDEKKNTVTVKFKIDLEKPDISGVDNNEYYKTKRTIKFKDNYGIKSATLNGLPIAISDEVTIDRDGKYTIVVTDLVGNSSKVEFCYDSTEPVISGVADDGIYKKNRVIKISDVTSGVDSVELDNTKYPAGTTSVKVTTKGRHTLYVYDKAGNKKRVSFTVDVKKPKITVSKKAKVGSKVTVEDDLGLNYVKVGKKKYKCDGEDSFECKLKKKGKTKIIAVDKAGNKVTKKVKVKAKAKSKRKKK